MNRTEPRAIGRHMITAAHGANMVAATFKNANFNAVPDEIHCLAAIFSIPTASKMNTFMPDTHAHAINVNVSVSQCMGLIR